VPIAVVALDDAPSSATLAAALATRLSAAGETVLTTAQLTQRLVGAAEPRDPSVAALQALLAEGREREAYFDKAGAEALRRQVMGAFDAALRPEAALRKVGAEAARDLAVASLIEGDPEAAREQTHEVWRRFGLVPIDAARLSPAIVRFLTAEREAAEATARVPVVVTSDRGGTLYADGMVLGRTDGKLVTALPAGDYRLWLETGGGWSLPRPIRVERGRLEVRIETALDSRLALTDPIALRCAASCKTDLAALARRVRAARIYGVRATGADEGWVLAVEAQTGESHDGSFTAARGLALRVERPGAVARFSPLYLVPFGGGQLAQHRTALGGAYAAAQLGLLAWHVSARVRYSGADAVSQESLRGETNLSLGLLIGAMAVNVVEALTVGYLSGDGS
jgi:hypothetical protein